MSLSVYVHVHTDRAPSDLLPEDAGVSGVYAVWLDPEVPRDGLAMAALDGFHDQVGVKRVADFLITVRQQDGELVPNEGVYENEQLLDYVLSVERTAEDPIGAEPGGD